MKKIILLILISGVTATSLLAQKLPLTNQYLVNRYVLSPSYAGLDDGVKIFASYRDQWVDFKGAPVTKIVNIHSPLGNNIGVGGQIISDKEGIFERLYGTLSYAYHLTLADVHKISFGLSGTFYQTGINLSNMYIQDLTNDQVLQARQTENETAFNAGASVLYSFQGINVGFSAPLIIQNKSRYYNENNIGSTDNYLLKRHFLAHASYDYDINDMISVTPYAIFRMTDYAPMNFEFAGQVVYKKMAWAALSYRKEGNLGASAGFQLNDQVYLNYTYEFMGKNMTGNTAGTHDISIGLVMGKAVKKLKEKQKELLESADSLQTANKALEETVKKAEEENKKDKTQMNNKIDILQQRLNDAELEMGKLKNFTETEYQTLTEPERVSKERELNTEILDIERKLKDVGGEFFVVVEAFKIPENAKKAVTLWEDRGLRTNMIYNDIRDFYYIYAGKYATYNEALQLKNKLKENGVFGWIYLWSKQ